MEIQLLFDRPIVELEDLRTELLAKMREMIADYCDFRAQRLLSDGFFPFGNVDYSSAASIPDNAKPSVPITRLVVSLHEVAAAIVSPIDRHDVISRCIENVMVSMTQQGWDTPRGPRPFGFGGVQQLVLGKDKTYFWFGSLKHVLIIRCVGGRHPFRFAHL